MTAQVVKLACCPTNRAPFPDSHLPTRGSLRSCHTEAPSVPPPADLSLPPWGFCTWPPTCASLLLEARVSLPRRRPVLPLSLAWHSLFLPALERIPQQRVPLRYQRLSRLSPAQQLACTLNLFPLFPTSRGRAGSGGVCGRGARLSGCGPRWRHLPAVRLCWRCALLGLDFLICTMGAVVRSTREGCSPVPV